MDIRYQTGQTLRINVLASNERLVGHIVNIEGRKATMNVDRPLLFGAPLRIDLDDSMILGEVSACAPAAEGHRVTIDVRDAIPMMSDLARLVAAVMSDGRGAPAEQRPTTRAARA